MTAVFDKMDLGLDDPPFTDAAHPYGFTEHEIAVECLRRLNVELDRLLECDPARLGIAAKTQLLSTVATTEARLGLARLRLLAVCDDAAAETGARDTAAWYANQTNTDPGPAKAASETAHGLTQTPQVAQALATGQVNLGQATAIVDAISGLPTGVDDQTRTKATTAMINHARRMSPKKLTARGKKILDEVDSTANHGPTTTQNEHDRARAKTTLMLTDKGDGTTEVSGTIPTSVASRLRTLIGAHTTPRGSDAALSKWRDADGNKISYHKRMGHAFCAIIEHIDPTGLPQHGGTATTVLITMDYTHITRDLAQAGIIDADDTPIPASEARRLMCNANLVPIVLGTDSQPLDIGRSNRLFKPHQITAMRVRDHHCQAEDCTIPAAWCEAHHLQPWSHGGHTNIHHGALLCSHHHHLVHDPRYRVEPQPNRQLRITLKT